MSEIYQAHTQKGIRLNANECSQPPNKKILETFKELLSNSELNRYPDDESFELRKAFGRQNNISIGNILAGNGSDALLGLMITTFCRNGKNLITLNPDFGMYDFYANSIQSKTISYKTNWDGSFDLDEFIQFAKLNHAGLVLFSNPNNPTGHLLSKEDIRYLAKKLDPIIIASDEAYMDFANESMIQEAADTRNLIITATLSKAWGAAGIRIGFLVANTNLIEQLNAYRVVYSVSTLDQLAAIAYLSHPEVMQDYVDMIQDQSNALKKEIDAFKSIEAGVFHANFFSIRITDSKLLLTDLENAFHNANISIRTYPDQSRIRITIGQPEENKKVLAVLKEFEYNAQILNEGLSCIENFD